MSKGLVVRMCACSQLLWMCMCTHTWTCTIPSSYYPQWEDIGMLVVFLTSDFCIRICSGSQVKLTTFFHHQGNHCDQSLYSTSLPTLLLFSYVLYSQVRDCVMWPTCISVLSWSFLFPKWVSNLSSITGQPSHPKHWRAFWNQLLGHIRKVRSGDLVECNRICLHLALQSGYLTCTSDQQGDRNSQTVSVILKAIFFTTGYKVNANS